MWLAKPGRTSSLALAEPSQLFWAPLLSHGAQDVRGPCTGCVVSGMSQLGLLAAAASLSAFSEQAQVGSGAQETECIS